MILDAQNLFSDAQALTGTAISENVIDLSQARSIGNGEPLCVLFVVDVAADQTTGDEDYTFDVKYASNVGLTAGEELLGRRVFESGTPTAPAQDADLLVAGYRFYIPLPATLASEDERYLGVEYTLAGTTPTLTITSALMPMSMIDSNLINYANGYTIT